MFLKLLKTFKADIPGNAMVASKVEFVCFSFSFSFFVISFFVVCFSLLGFHISLFTFRFLTFKIGTNIVC